MDKAKAEVFRYLGYQGQSVAPELDALASECMLLMRGAAAPRHVRRAFGIRPAPGGVTVESTGLLLRGDDIRRHLDGCRRAVLLAATLGAAADSLIRRYEAYDLTRALVLDACAAQLIEQFCDGLEEQVCREANEEGLMITPRFSPGYGDLPLDIQPKLLDVLDAGRKTGLTCTDSLILLPRKSVTAVIGLGKNPSARPVGCEGCSLNKTCGFRKGKDMDGHN